MAPDGEPPAPVRALRDRLVAGWPNAEDDPSFADDMTGFLCDDLGALRHWLGDIVAERVRSDPAAVRGLLDRDIVALDRRIARQLDAILHHPRLQEFEASWRGLFWLAQRIEPDSRVVLRVLSASWRDVARDLDRAIEFDQTTLFRLIYEEEFGLAGGEPFGLLVLDREVRHRPPRREATDTAAPVDDVSVLKGLAAIGTAAFAPVIVGASPELLGADRFEDLALSQDPAAALRDPDHNRWRSLAAMPEARFLGVTLPRVLARPTWKQDPYRRDGFQYAETVAAIAERVWFSAAYAFAATVIRAHTLFGWPADIRGVTPERAGGGIVLDLPADPFVLGPDTVLHRTSLDLSFTDAQERSLVEAGLLPLCAMPFGPEAVFPSVRSLHTAPVDGVGREASVAVANARLSAQLNSVLCASRFAHYVKVIGREMVGNNKSTAEISYRLRHWLGEYANANLDAGPDTRARYPLVDYGVEIREIEGRPGAFSCVLHLQPYHQLDGIATAFRLATELSVPGVTTGMTA